LPRGGREPTCGSFLSAEFANPVSALLVSAERSLAAEFPGSASARAVRSSIGHGERTFPKFARDAGGICHSILTRATDVLVGKRVGLPVNGVSGGCRA
jgi:hypothetical protein